MSDRSKTLHSPKRVIPCITGGVAVVIIADVVVVTVVGDAVLSVNKSRSDLNRD
jgi:hypothetical protein